MNRRRNPIAQKNFVPGGVYVSITNKMKKVLFWIGFSFLFWLVIIKFSYTYSSLKETLDFNCYKQNNKINFFTSFFYNFYSEKVSIMVEKKNR